MKHSFSQDIRCGRISEYKVSIDGDDFVFEPYKKSEELKLLSEIPEEPKDTYLEFTGITNDVLKVCNCKTMDNLMEAYKYALFGFAQLHGPLFGYRCENEEKGEIREPLNAWISAQRVMFDLISTKAFIEGSLLENTKFLDSFFYKVEIQDDKFFIDLIYQPNFIAPEEYRDWLRPHISKPYTTEDKTIKYSLWSNGSVDPTDGRMLEKLTSPYAQYTQGDDIKKHLLFPEMVSLGDSKPLVKSLKELVYSEDILGLTLPYVFDKLTSLLRIVAEAHLADVYFAFLNPDPEGDEEEFKRYDVCFNSYLAFMWHNLCLDYDNSKLFKCANKKCCKFFTKDINTKKDKKCCCEACRIEHGNQRIAEERTRASIAFYDDKDYWEGIYKKTFNQDISIDMTPKELVEFRRQAKRLNRWLDGWKVTKKGKIAQKYGAGEFENKELMQQIAHLCNVS